MRVWTFPLKVHYFSDINRPSRWGARICEGLMAHSAIEQYQALESAYFENTKRSERSQARFSALAGLSADGDAQAIVRKALREKTALNDRLSSWRSPSSSLRLVYGAALSAAKRDGGALVEMMNSLRDERKRRGGRTLQSGGAPAALALLCAGGNVGQAGMFYDVLEEIAAPWWRRRPLAEESYAALQTAMGETPEIARKNIEQTKQLLESNSVPGSARNSILFEVAAANPDEDDFSSAWTALNIAARQKKGLLRRVKYQGLAVLAAQVEDGSTAGDALNTADEFVQSLRPRVDSMAAGRLTVRLAAIMSGIRTPAGAAADYAAILAAQAAMIAAVTASSAAVVAAT